VIPLSIALALLILLLLILIPFLPAIKELFRPRDEKPLALNMNFSKDHKYFGRSFQKILERGLGARQVPEPGEYTLTLSKPEKIRVVESEKESDHKTTEEILYVLGDLTSGSQAQFKKEIYVKGACVIGNRNTLRALYGERNLILGAGTSVIRWIDGDGEMVIGEGCRLGLSATASGRMTVGQGCTFSRLFGLPILTYASTPAEIPKELKVRNISDTTIVITRKEMIIPPRTTLPGDLVTHLKIILRQQSTAGGNIKSYSDIIVERGSRIEGNLFAEKNVIIGAGCTVLGHIFSQGRVEIGNGTQVGREGQIRSVIAKKGVLVEGNVSLNGYLMTEGEGKIL
jgi:predicted acyltransferase (DUF342 family)